MTLEALNLRLKNVAQKLLEKGSADQGVLFVPADFQVREISEALLIDGELPSVINEAVISLSQTFKEEQREDYQKLLHNQVAIIRDQMLLEGADSTTINQVIADTLKAIAKPADKPILSTYEPAKRISLQGYNPSQKDR